jgi:FkbM family methyltransferase
MNYYSQHQEDRWIEENLKPSIGKFCEVGAFDGVLSSNTLHFEQLGWQGILVEADPTLAAKCQLNRQARTFCCAAGTPAEFRPFKVNTVDRGLSGFGRPGEPIWVEARRLEDLLRASNCTDVSLLSIDTEGTELEVWQSIGLIRPAIVIMEYWTMPEQPVPDPIVAQMVKDGYREVHRTTCNLVFVKG